MNLRLAAALDYASHGFDPLPLSGKKPLQRRWQDRRLADPKLIRRAWGRWPDANIGLRTGDGLIVLDVDPRSGGDESIGRLCVGRRWLPETATGATGGGGRHYWYRIPPSEPIGCRQGLLGFSGLDLKGRGGQVLVEPSIHPETGREYVWTRTLRSGIAPCPRWLLRLLSLDRDRDGSSEREAIPLPEEVRSGQVEVLAAGLIEKFPVPGYGRRNDLMVRCVGSVLGGGYCDTTVILAVTAWWVHFHDLGRIWTPPSKARTEIGKTIDVLRRSPRFGRAIGETDHRDACKKIVLTGVQVEKLEGQIPEPPTANTKSLTLTRGRLCERLCVSDDERAFVEGLIVHVIHRRTVEPGDLFRMTNDQLRTIVADRYSGKDWDDTQFERLKAKYITRPSKPATRFELLLELEKGSRKRGEMIGKPSTYRPTGVMALLELR